uniref:Uncharacterized protein n=1 Tax=Pseudo-nitzschia australis TaxID=44445 RepID=A0A7S4AIB4_9STRA|mmetsp:Transcript_15443/g.33312  ORF Transcript_15443/g.33312 Transcript_15443/m.33312 type:complete len:324 (+) Transcript_15443:80-1051(+)|eukprot:CAMPEP_0168203640 /NCGR_PEP_ID=MMETSP0139_2-20121125/24964_1 /TAXON_ID=44445 /ORGANISM="Pseudo-nitzschia australis, Strain 10249 10 AB" /LENGTH=323 /DNA_ID=CAMNT_0008129509 /DNA_START=31 /DNA_END=1002 /DNA_ORIENTATION=+
MTVLALPAYQAITSAFLLKLTTSLDDLLWLSPFLSLSPTFRSKLKHSVVYFVICVFVTMLAFVFGTTLLSLTSRGGANSHGYWNPERCLSVFSASVLCYIARNDFLEWKEENYQKSNNDELEGLLETNKENGHTAIETKDIGQKINDTKLRSRSNASRSKSSLEHSFDLERGGLSTSFSDDGSDDEDSDDEEIRAKIEEASKSLRRFVTVCIMGTLDDMIVFSAFVAGGGGGGGVGGGVGVGGGSVPGHNVNEHDAHGGMELRTITTHSNLALFIGTTFAALFIVTVSWFFSEIECFKRMVKKIPMWALLLGIAVYILAMGLL